jgi:REP element-mobilizing transposase RayT
MTQGRRWRANLGLEDTIPLGLADDMRYRAALRLFVRGRVPRFRNAVESSNRIRTIHVRAGEPLPIWHPSVMPQSLSAVYIHLVFSTKDRRPLLRDKTTRDALHAYLGGVSKQLDCPPLLVGGVEDHIHLLARFGRTITQAEWVKELKRVSNLWLKERGRDYADFEWQGGYAGFSVSQSNLEQVKQYIAGQEEHHRKIGFQDELRALLRKHDMEWDEKYVWD